MTQTIENKVISRIYGHGRGWVFTPIDFLDIATRPTIDTTLRRLVKSDKISKVARGIYCYPETHPVMGELSPSPEKIAKALACKDQVRVQPSGAYAANLLGLSEQVPAKIVFLTDGMNRTVKVGKQNIILKRTTPKNMKTAGIITGLVIQALRHIGKDHVDNKIVKRLKQKLKKEDRERLLKDIRLAPAWIGVIFRKIAEKE